MPGRVTGDRFDCDCSVLCWWPLDATLLVLYKNRPHSRPPRRSPCTCVVQAETRNTVTVPCQNR